MKRAVLNAVSLLAAFVAVGVLTSCHESLEDRAVRETREFTEKYCPTPPENETITDSITFDKASKTYTTYLTLIGSIDNPPAIKELESEIWESMHKNLLANAGLSAYKEAGFSFSYVCRSQKEKRVILVLKFTKKDY